MADYMERRVTDGKMDKKHRSAKLCEYLPYSGREAYKRLRTNVMIALTEISEKEHYVLGITSAQPSEGKSSVAVNLAYSLAELGHSVLLVDVDLRRPSIHEKIGVTQEPGLSDILTGDEDFGTTILKYTSTENDTRFDFMTSGSNSERPSEILNSSRFRKMIEVLSGAYDYLILDLPPVGPVVDAVNVSKLTDGLLLVVRENHCPKELLVSSVEQLKYAKANVLGFVMNGCMEGAAKKYQYSYEYYKK